MKRDVGALGARLRWNQDVADVALAVVLAAAVLFVAGLGAAGARSGGTPDARQRRSSSSPRPCHSRSGAVIRCSCWPRRSAGIGLYSLLGYVEAGGNLGVLVALYTVAAHTDRRTAMICGALSALGILLVFANYVGHQQQVAEAMLGVYVEFSAAWVFGTYLQGRRQDVQVLQERAARLEDQREERARLAVAEERARIARELHDVVAHHVSVMVVQAGAARFVVGSDPASARAAMAAVESAGRTALSEMRRMLEVLRADEPDLEPEPSLVQVESLVARVRAAGLPVDLRVEGERPDVPAGTDLAAYRIVQEALTNVVKHAGRATASVRIGYAPDRVEVEVTDDGRGAAAHLGAESGGRGLVGMRERALLYGGTLEAGPRTAGGYRVHAAFPIEPSPPPLERSAGYDAVDGEGRYPADEPEVAGA